MSLASTLTTAVLPLLVIAVVGFVFGRRYPVDVEPLNTVTLYVLLPALIFHSLATTTLAGETIAKIAAGVVAYVVAMLLLAETVGRLLGMAEPYLSAFVLESATPAAITPLIFVTTLASVVVLTVLIDLLQSGGLV